MTDLAIRGATVVDGSGRPRFRATVGVTNGLIEGVRHLATGEPTAPDVDAALVLDGEGLVLAPGFVDVHNHSDLAPLIDPSMPSTLRQGATTVVVGNCGYSGWPVSLARELLAWAGGDAASVDLGFDSFGSWLDVIERSRPAVNVAALVGHGSVRQEVMGLDRRPPSDDELAEMRRLVAEAMEAGAVGLSTGLVYVPGMFSATDEVVRLAGVASAAGGVYASHIRGEGENVFRAVDEALEIGRRADVPVHISHLKLESSPVWGRSAELLARVHDGPDATADQYPYAAYETHLSSLLPDWAPVRELTGLLAEPRTRELLVRSIEEGEGEAFQSSVRGVGWERIVVEWTADEDCRGRSIEEIAGRRGVPPVDALFQLLQEDPDSSCIGHAMDEDDVRAILADPEIMVASDAVAASTDGPLAHLPTHPRTYGTFPRALGPFVRDGVLTLENAVRKMTSLPADRFGLDGRGRVVEGAVADLVLFDPAEVADRGTFEAPHAYPEGIEAVIVGGVLAWSRERPAEIERAGAVLRRPS